VGFVVDKVAEGQVFLRVFLFTPVNIIHPMVHNSYASTRCYYQKDKRAKPVNFPKSNAVSEMGEHWIERYFVFLVFKELKTGLLLLPPDLCTIGK
jgi:hypothetical protein